MSQGLIIGGTLLAGYLIYRNSQQDIGEEKNVNEVLDEIPEPEYEKKKLGMLPEKVKDAILMKLHKPRDYSTPLIIFFILSGTVYWVKVFNETWPFLDPSNSSSFKAERFEDSAEDILYGEKGTFTRDIAEKRKLARINKQRAEKKAIHDQYPMREADTYPGEWNSELQDIYEEDPDRFKNIFPLQYKEYTASFVTFNKFEKTKYKRLLRSMFDSTISEIDNLEVEIKEEEIIDIIKRFQQIIADIINDYNINLRYVINVIRAVYLDELENNAPDFIKFIRKMNLKISEDLENNVNFNEAYLKNFINDMLELLDYKYEKEDYREQADPFYGWLNKPDFLIYQIKKYQLLLNPQTKAKTGLEELKKLVLYAARDLKDKNRDLAEMLMGIYRNLVDDVQTEKINEENYLKNMIYDLLTIVNKFPDEDNSKLADLKRYLLNL